MNKTLKFIFGLSVLCASFISCSQKKDTPSSDKSDWYIDQRQSEQMVRTMTDTLAVLYNVKKYLDYQKANELDSALNMLYIPDGDDVLPLPDDKKLVIRRTMEMFPIRDYKIDRLNLFSESTSEVHYTIQYGISDDVLSSMKCVIVPVRVGYYWYLTIPDENYQLNPETLGE